MNIKIKKLNKNAITPTRGSAGAAGCDLYTCTDKPIAISAGETVKIGTGLSIAIPEGFFGAIFARSGLATKKGLRPANCVGVADEDYRGEYIVALHNDSSVTQIVEPGERIAQLIILPYWIAEFEEVDSLDETERGSGSFGSTGTN
jgi:dUTP pyrophosphatase